MYVVLYVCNVLVMYVVRSLCMDVCVVSSFVSSFVRYVCIPFVR